MALIAKDDGTHYSKEALGNFFREAVEAAGIPVSKRGSTSKGFSAHGLRKELGNHRRRELRQRGGAQRHVRLARASDWRSSTPRAPIASDWRRALSPSGPGLRRDDGTAEAQVTPLRLDQQRV